MSEIVTREDIIPKVAEGAQLVEVLGRDEYQRVHLRDAINIPLSELGDRHVELDRETDVIVYCWDYQCDLSPRAAARLDTLGFPRVFDYAASKMDWLAAGLPVEGTEARARTAVTIAERDVSTLGLQDTAGDARLVLGDRRFAIVTDAAGVVLGRLDADRLRDAANEVPVTGLMTEGPDTWRADVKVHDLLARMGEDDLAIITTPSGTLIGVVERSTVLNLPEAART